MKNREVEFSLFPSGLATRSLTIDVMDYPVGGLDMHVQSTELVHFHRFVSEKLQSGATGISPEEALDEWRLDHRASDEFQATVTAIQEAITDMRAGDLGTPLADFDGDIRSRHGFLRQRP
jgi:hypothetical protein